MSIVHLFGDSIYGVVKFNCQDRRMSPWLEKRLWTNEQAELGRQNFYNNLRIEYDSGEGSFLNSLSCPAMSLGKGDTTSMIVVHTFKNVSAVMNDVEIQSYRKGVPAPKGFYEEARAKNREFASEIYSMCIGAPAQLPSVHVAAAIALDMAYGRYDPDW